MNRKQYTILILAALVIGISTFLIIETAGFYYSVFTEAGRWKAIMAAVLLETSAVFLILWQPKIKEVKIVKCLIIMAFFATIVFCATLFAIQPILDSDTISNFDNIKIQSLQDQIIAQQKAIDAVQGQKMNVALAVKTMNDLQASLMAAYREASVSSGTVVNIQINNFKIFLLLSVRCLLQISNWLFAHLILILTLQTPEQKSKPASKPEAIEPVRSQQTQSSASLDACFDNESKPVKINQEISAPALKVVRCLERKNGLIKRPVLQAAVKLPALDSAIEELVAIGMIQVSHGGNGNGHGKKTDEVYALTLSNQKDCQNENKE
jgi:hypothetical protein